jgi:phosphatidylserine/phosphatidylglycerophosphate/cardiolipin synthase-like enzyme
MSRSEIDRICGNCSAAVSDYLGELYSSGFSPKHVLAIIQAVLEQRTSVEPLSHILELIVSGPDVPGIPVGDTFAAMHTLVQHAKREIIVAGYSIYNGKTVFKSLAERMDSKGDLRVVFLVHIGRDGKDTTIEADLVARYARRFTLDNWPGQRLPEMYYDPRSLAIDPAMRSSFHPKCLLVDGGEALVTSANFTRAAQTKNVEVGIKIKAPILVARLRTYFLSLVERGNLKRVYLPTDSR